jgi:CubicO group peptidase (beta-lactamase class C family)
MKRRSPFFCIAVLVAQLSPAIEAADLVTDEKNAAVDALFTKWNRAGSPGFVVGIFQDGEMLYGRGYGMANLEYDIPITTRSVFRTGSIGKQFTAMSIALLDEAGKLSLDDDIRKYLPEMPDLGTPVTIRHLVHQTSGMRDYLVLQGLASRVGDYYFTQEQALDLMSRQRGLNFQPGERYQYSNSNFTLLADIVTRASGMSLAEFARTNIFEPLGMNDSHVHDDRNRVVRNRASGYASLEDGGYRIDMTQLEIVGDGAVFTTLEDMAKWDQNYFENRLGKGSQDLLDTVLTPGRLNDGSEIEYAFGQFVDTYRGLRRIRHTGSYKGFRAANMMFPDQRVAIIILANTSDWNSYDMPENVADIYLAELLGGARPVRETRDWQGVSEQVATDFPLSDHALQEFAGRYYSEELDAFADLRMIDGEFRMVMERTVDPLTPVSEDRFHTTYINDDAYEPMDRYLRFERDADGKVAGFSMDAAPIIGIRFERRPRN